LGATRREACSLNLTLLEKVCGTNEFGLGSKRPHSVGAFGGAIDAVDSALAADPAASAVLGWHVPSDTFVQDTSDLHLLATSVQLTHKQPGSS
jgi:hypothetical protein